MTSSNELPWVPANPVRQRAAEIAAGMRAAEANERAHTGRTNSHGQPCPAWCVTDHAEDVIPGRPELGRMDRHYSAPLRGAEGTPGAVRLALSAAPDAIVTVRVALTLGGLVSLSMTPDEAAGLADVIDAGRPVPASAAADLGAGLRAAASLARQAAAW
jgi:hypothetical protein